MSLALAALLLLAPAALPAQVPGPAELVRLAGGERADDAVAGLQAALGAQGATASPDEWVAVPAALFEAGHAEAALQAVTLLEKRWQRHPSVLGCKGAVLAVLERDEEALIYLRAAAEASPEDPVHRWNLARLLAYAGRTGEASAEFARWSALETDRERLIRNSCAYAQFVERQVGDAARACRLQQEFCPEPQRTACATAPPETPK